MTAPQLNATTDPAPTFQPAGDWSVRYADKLGQLAEPSDAVQANALLDGSKLERIDTTGAWYLLNWIRTCEKKGISFKASGFSEDHQRIIELVGKLASAPQPSRIERHTPYRTVIGIGRTAHRIFREFYLLIAFFGQVASSFAHVMAHPSRFRMRSLVSHLYQVGIQAIPIVSLLALLISIVIGYQGIEQLKRFNAQAFTVDASVISILREMGVLLTAIMVAGRSGSAFTASIGTMKLNQEVDAMRTLGLDPFEVLILPRLLAIVIALPLLVFIADIVGMLGTFFVANSMLDMGWQQFFSRVGNTLKLRTFMVGIIKAPVFALLIGTVGCMRGMQVKGAASEVGSETTTSVVYSIFLILLADAIFSIIFTLLKV